MIQPVKDRLGPDGIRFSGGDGASANLRYEGTKRQIGSAGTERHVRESVIVMGDPDPGLQREAQMAF